MAVEKNPATLFSAFHPPRNPESQPPPSGSRVPANRLLQKLNVPSVRLSDHVPTTHGGYIPDNPPLTQRGQQDLLLAKPEKDFGINLFSLFFFLGSLLSASP